MIDLSGDLGSFGLARVLQLLGDAGKDGELRIHAEEHDGRILLKEGQVAYATTADGSGTVEELDALLERYQSGVLPSDLTTLEEVLEEQLVEVVHLLTQAESGSFEFLAATGQSPDDVHTVPVADLLAMVETRAEEWREIRRMIPSNDEPYRLSSQLPSHHADVTLSRAQWAMLAAAGSGASVVEASSALNLSEFHTAGAFADLLGDGLIQRIGGSARPPAEESDEPGMPHLQPTEDAVTFSTADLSSEEINELIRNMGRGIFPN